MTDSVCSQSFWDGALLGAAVMAFILVAIVHADWVVKVFHRMRHPWG